MRTGKSEMRSFFAVQLLTPPLLIYINFNSIFDSGPNTGGVAQYASLELCLTYQTGNEYQ